MLVGWGGVTQDGLTVRQTMGQHLTKVVSIPAVALPGPGLSQTTAVRRMQSQVNRCNERKWWEGGGGAEWRLYFPRVLQKQTKPFFPPSKSRFISFTSFFSEATVQALCILDCR